jgi:drug/metabolite transporter (DMT)-like permease
MNGLNGLTFALLASALWGFSTVFGKFLTRTLSFPVTSFLRFAFGFAGMLGLLLARIATTESSPSQIFAYFASDPKAIQAILYMGLVPGVLAMYLYYAGLKRTSASVATFVELFFPIAAVLVNWHFLGQGLAALQIFGSALLLVSVYFINGSTK